MRLEKQKISRLFKGKVSLATLVVTPLVLCGLGLLGFQTYSLITGKSFKDLNFDIGRLWESKIPEIEDEITDDNVVYYVNPPIDNVKIEEIISPRIRKKYLQVIEPKKPRITQTEEIIPNSSIFSKEYSLLTAISDIDIRANFDKPILIKYYSRLESEYLIDPNIVPKTGKWYLGVSFSPMLCYRNFGYDAQNVSGVAVNGNHRYIYGLTESERNQSDKAISSFNVGIDIGRRVSERLSIYTGIYYSNYGEQIQVSEVQKSDPNLQQSSFMNKEPMYENHSAENKDQSIPYINRYSYIEVPIGISYNLLTKDKFKISLDGGINLQKLDNVNAMIYDFETDYYYWITEKEEIFRIYGIGVTSGLTLSQHVGERLEMFLNPQFRYNLNSTFKEPYPVNQNQYSTGLRIGLKRHLF